MADHLKLWQQVEKTPVEHTKAITGKSYSGTSPKPHYLVHKATETFGPCGIGWGFTVDERIENGAMIEPGHFEKMHIAKVTVWYDWQGKRGEVCHVGGTPFSGRRKPKHGEAQGAPYTDEDAPKKSVTDALVKALSMIGFAGDIFMGRYDDSKYVNDLKDESRQASRRTEKPHNQDDSDIDRKIADTMIEAIGVAKTLDDLKLWTSKQTAEIEALGEFERKRVKREIRAQFNELNARPSDTRRAG